MNRRKPSFGGRRSSASAAAASCIVSARSSIVFTSLRACPIGFPVCRVMSKATVSLMDRNESMTSWQILTRSATGTSRQSRCAAHILSRIDSSSASVVGSTPRKILSVAGFTSCHVELSVIRCNPPFLYECTAAPLHRRDCPQGFGENRHDADFARILYPSRERAAPGFHLRRCSA